MQRMRILLKNLFKLIKISIVHGIFIRYNKHTTKACPDYPSEIVDIIESIRKEDIHMTAVSIKEKLKDLQFSPQQLKDLGVEVNWQDNIPIEFIEQVVAVAEKYKKAMEELKKY